MTTRIPYAIGHGPQGDYVAAPVHAFDPIRPGQIDETYPFLKQHVVIATGTKTECLTGERVLTRARKALGTNIKLDHALQLLEELSRGPEARDFSRCHRCYGDGSVYVKHQKIRCPLCGGSGRGMR